MKSVRSIALLFAAGLLGACGGENAAVGDAAARLDAGTMAGDAGPREAGPRAPWDAGPRAGLRVVTFNTGTTAGLAHDADVTDGFTSATAIVSDTYYGDGLAWERAVRDTTRLFAELDADIVAFQEIFHSPDCAGVPESARPGFVCESWRVGDPTVAQRVLGPSYQVACNLGKNDKCLAVHRRVGTFRGCSGDVCLDHLAGARVMDCGGGSRVGRGVIELVTGGTLTVVLVHGSSGANASDTACRVAQFRQAFEDLGDGSGEPGANGARNLVLGDFNTDPVRFEGEPSADYLRSQGTGAARFAFHTATAASARPTYAGVAAIDHVLSDGLVGGCFHPGITPGTPPPTEMVYFDHRPAVCDLRMP